MTTSLRSIPSEFDPATVAAIDAALDGIISRERVTMPLAIESGSRAWGFPSPDSDYDCRFIYVRRLDDYLTPWPKRDVIELPLEGVLDINGWDLAKALQLMVKGNAVVLEWLQSPIAYRGDPWFRDRFLDLARHVVDRNAIARHYYHLGKLQWDDIQSKGDGAKIKKLFYALRPAMALRWLSERPTEAVPPMHFPTMVADCNLDPSLRSDIAMLIAEKSKTKEMGAGITPPSIASFIGGQFSTPPVTLAPSISFTEACAEADQFFRDTVRHYG